MPVMTREPCQLYLITPQEFDLDAYAPDFEAALAAAPKDWPVASIQLRLKDVDDDTIRRAIERLMPIAHRYDTAFILNDRPDLAVEMGCDGVHIGVDDMAVADARKIVGPNAIVGASCYDSRDLAMRAGEAGADYVAFGAFYHTTTKTPRGYPDPSILTWWQELMELPCVAIGGIKPDNARPLIDAGADFICVVSAVWQHPQGPAAAVKAFYDVMAQAADVAA